MKRLLLTACAMSLAAVVSAQTASRSISIRPQPDSDLSVRVWTGQREYRVGENVQINYRTNRDAYVLIFTTDARGETRQLLPNAYDSENFTRGGVTYSIPNRGYSLEVTPPTGRETISIVAFKERYRALEAYRARKSEAFPKSDGPRAAIARIIPRPNDERNESYAEDSTSIQVIGRWNRPDWPDRPDYPDYPDRDDYGRLTIKSDPSGAYVYIDRRYRGITPLDLRQVRTGTYSIYIQRAGFYPVQKRVRVTDDDRTRVNEDLRRIRYR